MRTLEGEESRGDAESYVAAAGLAVGLAAIIIASVTLVVLCDATLRQAVDANNSLSRICVIKGRLDWLSATIVETVAAQPFIVPGEPAPLAAYADSTDAITPEIARLRLLTADRPDDQADLDRLLALVEVQKIELPEGLRPQPEVSTTRRTKIPGMDAVPTAVRMRALVAGMDAREDTLLRTQIAKAEQQYRSALITCLGSACLPPFAAIAWFLATGRRRRRSMAANDTITQPALHKRS